MNRILLSAPNNDAWCFGTYLEAALSNIGADVHLFDFRSVKDANRALLDIAAHYRPKLHIIWKGERLTPTTLRKLRSVGVLNVLWYPDGDIPEWLVPLAQASDLCCTQGSLMRDRLRQLGVGRVERLLEGITPECFHYDSMTANEQQEYACDVVTIGTIDRHPRYRRRLHALNRLLREGIHVKWWGKKLSFSQNSLRDSFSPARRAWGRRGVRGPEFAKACHGAKIFLAIPYRPERPGGLSNRALWVTGVGSFYLSQYKAGIEEFFEPGKEIAVFEDEQDMINQVRYYLTHPEARAAIAAAGQRRTLAEYTNQQAFRQLFDMVTRNDSGLAQTINPPLSA
mgnify:CR=1 FL=1